MGRKAETLIKKIFMKEENLLFLLKLDEFKFLDSNSLRREGLHRFDTTLFEFMDLVEFTKSADPSFILTARGKKLVEQWKNFVAVVNEIVGE